MKLETIAGQRVLLHREGNRQRAIVQEAVPGECLGGLPMLVVGNHRLNSLEVAKLVDYLIHWLSTGKLSS